jgi:heptosyltransferase-2
MATAVKTPVLAIFGSTVEELGFFPFRSIHCVIQNDGLKCRPCSHIGKDYCPKGHFSCMSEIEPKLVYDELIELI